MLVPILDQRFPICFIGKDTIWRQSCRTQNTLKLAKSKYIVINLNAKKSSKNLNLWQKKYELVQLKIVKLQNKIMYLSGVHATLHLENYKTLIPIQPISSLKQNCHIPFMLSFSALDCIFEVLILFWWTNIGAN